jgi:putative transposase
MSNYIRSFLPGGTFFITIVTYKRHPFLTTPLARHILKKAWGETCREKPFQLIAICLLPDHLHCLITLPDKDSDFSKRIQMIKGLFSIQYLKSGGKEEKRSMSCKKKGEAAVSQRRFWEHTIRDKEDM